MDLGWIVTLASGQDALVQFSIMGEGGSGTQVPDISIEVDDVNTVFDRALEMGIEPDYPLTDEPWACAGFTFATPPEP